MRRGFVTVVSGDYTYTGWIVADFHKLSGQRRYVVEDEHGRLFIHNNGQLRFESQRPLSDGEQRVKTGDELALAFCIENKARMAEHIAKLQRELERARYGMRDENADQV